MKTNHFLPLSSSNPLVGTVYETRLERISQPTSEFVRCQKAHLAAVADTHRKTTNGMLRAISNKHKGAKTTRPFDMFPFTNHYAILWGHKRVCENWNWNLFGILKFNFRIPNLQISEFNSFLENESLQFHFDEVKVSPMLCTC